MELPPIIHLNSLPSTNDYAKTLVAGGKAVVVVADEQTAGKGQFDRRWSSPPGGLYCSFLLWPDCDSADFTRLSLATAEVVADLTRDMVGAAPDVYVKAPNDVYLDDKKLAGILLETRAAASWVIIGIGINIKRIDDAPSFAYLTDYLPAATPSTVLDVLTSRLTSRLCGAQRKEA
jgi:BirA family biotin operon repressor/biotin-[acetyl-CoA-carboxylase] ligase